MHWFDARHACWCRFSQLAATRYFRDWLWSLLLHMRPPAAVCFGAGACAAVKPPLSATTAVLLVSPCRGSCTPFFQPALGLVFISLSRVIPAVFLSSLMAACRSLLLLLGPSAAAILLPSRPVVPYGGIG